jgi:hypothetical protein
MASTKRSKTEERAILITEAAIFKLDPKHHFRPMKDGIRLSKVTRVLRFDM